MPGSSNTFNVVCSLSGSGWSVRVPEFDLESWAAELCQVEIVARALIATCEPDEPGTVDFIVEYLPDTPAASPLPAAPLSGANRSLANQPCRPHHDYRHEAFFYSGEEEFLAGTVPFIEHGLALGQPVMVALPEPRLTLVRQALGASARDVKLVDMARLGRNPARIIPAWREFLDEDGRDGRPARGIGDPRWPGRRPAETAECQLHEALLNQALDPATPLWLRCPYDADNLGVAEIEVARDSHPMLVEESRERESPTYQGASFGAGMLAGVLPDPPVTAAPFRFDPGTVRDVREHVLRHAVAADLDAARAAELVLAVWELVVNSIQHGGGGGDLRIWRETGALVCEVSDHGHFTDPLAGRRSPAAATLGARGIWLVNQLCDLVQLRSTPQGATIRVFTWL